MLNINSKKLKIIVSELSNEIYLVQESDQGNGTFICADKINITQDVINAIMKHAFLSTDDNSKGVEWESKVGTLTFRKKD